MHFKISTSDLVEAVRIAQKGVSRNAKSNIFEGIVFEAKENNLTLYSSDLKISIKTTIVADVLEEGRWVLNSAMIADILRYIDGDTVEIKVLEDANVRIKSGKSKVNISAMSASEYPAFPDYSYDYNIKLNSSLFKDLIRYTRVSVSFDENRLIYTGVKFKIENETIEGVSLDGCRISITKKEAKGLDKNMEFIVPLSSLNEIEKLLKDDEDVLIGMSKNHAVFSFSNTIFYTKLLEGEFHDFSSIIDADGKTKVIIDLKPFLLSLERSSVVAKGSLNIVKIEIEDGNMHLSSIGNMGQTDDDIRIGQEGEDLTIGFNAKYLIDGLKMFDEDKVELSFGDSQSPVIIRGMKHKNEIYVVLPVRLSQ